jgi:hypothetical protein
MKLTFDFDRLEYYFFSVRSLRLMRVQRMVLALSVLALSAIGFVLGYAINPVELVVVRAFYGMLIAFALFTGLSLFIFLFKRLMIIYNTMTLKAPLLFCAHELELGDTELIERTAGMTSRIPYSALYRIAEYHKRLYIFVNPGTGYAIARYRVQRGDFAEFCNELEGKANLADVKYVRRGRFRTWFSMI